MATTSTPPAASTPLPASKDVQGKIIDYYRRPLSGVEVKIGTATATTDKDGKFTIPNVADTYTVDFSFDRDDRAGNSSNWRYIGLTRRDPTLQSFHSNQPEREVALQVRTDLPNSSTDETGVSLGVLSASRHYDISPTGSDLTPTWNGPTPVTAKGHALVKHKTGEAVTGYGAYISQDFSLADKADIPWEMKLKDATAVATANISGSVSIAKAEMLENSVLVLFNGGGAIELHDAVTPADAAFTYLVPSIPNSSLLVAARSNAIYGLWYSAYAYKSGLAAGQTGVALAIPAYPVPKTPDGIDPVTPSTVFSWTADATVSVIWFRDGDSPSRGYYAVTSKKSHPLSELIAEPLHKGRPYGWEVSTHRTCASMDECAGADGVLDPLYEYQYSSQPLGPITGSGTGSWSGLSYFSMAP